MADANYWVHRVFARNPQTRENIADVLAVDSLPPIHAGSRVSNELQQEFRRLLKGGFDDEKAEPFSELKQHNTEGEKVINCFTAWRGEVLLGHPITK